MAVQHILVVEDDAFLQKLISDYLRKKGYEVETAVNGVEGIAKAKAVVPDLIVSDVIMPVMDGYEMVRQLRRNPPTVNTPIIILTALGEVSNKIMGFETGADDYMVKPFDLTELELRVKALLARTKPVADGTTNGPQGKVFAVFSLRGGVGKSTLAVNLAVSLAQLWNRPVPLLDLALNVGHASMMLNVRPKMTLTDLMRSEDTVQDIDVIRKVLTPAPCDVQLLAAPEDAAGSERVSASLIGPLIDTMRENYHVTVIDTAPSFDDVNLTVLDHSDLILLILAQEMGSVLASRRALDVFKQLAYPPNKVAILINGLIARPKLPRDNIERALGHPALAMIRHDPDVMVRAIDQGMPAVLLDPNAVAPATIEILAYHLSRDLEPELVKGEPSEVLSRVKKRLSLKK